MALLAGSVVAKFTSDLTDFKKGISEVQSGVSSLKDNTVNASKTITKGLLAIGAGLVFLGKQAVTESARFEQTQVAFSTMLGSAEKADEVLRKLADFAARTPFELKGIEDTARLLLATGADVDNLTDELKMLGDVSAGLSIPIERVALNFGQVRTQGKLTGRELRDFAILGVPIIDELAKVLGKTKEEITDMTSKGEIGFEDVRQAFANMSGEGGKFFDLMDKQADTLNGKISNLKDKWNLFLRAVGIDARESAKVFVDFLANEMLPKLEQFINFIKENPAVLAGLGATILTLVVPAFVAWAIAAGSAALATLAAAAPLMLLAAGIGVAVYLIMTHWENLKLAFETGKQFLIDTFLMLTEAMIAFFTPIAEWIDIFILTPWQLAFAVIARILYEIWGVISAVWNAIAGFAASIWAQIKNSIVTPIIEAAARVKAVNEEAKATVLNIFNQLWEGLKSIGAKILEAIVAPFRAARDKIRDIANEIKELAQKISPFHKESPSLVELVEAGTGKIADSYAGLVDKVKNLDFRGDLFGAVMSGGLNLAPSEATNRSVETNINISGVQLGDPIDLNTFAERLGFEMQRRTDL